MLVFTPNTIVGGMDEPFIVHFDGVTDLVENYVNTKVYPNPIDRGAIFSVALSTNKVGSVKVEIVNALGETVSALRSNQHPISVKAPNVAGVYMVRIIIDDKVSYCQKLIVK